MEEHMERFERDGYVVIPDFLSNQEVQDLKNECCKLVQAMNPKEHGEIFITGEKQSAGQYFMTSGDKIRYFFEDGVKDENGDLTVEKHLSLNKIGHALHWLNPVFKKVTFSKKVKNLLKALGASNPAIVQSMYIFKNAGQGGEVTPHQDATFVHSTPERVTGLWFPLEDATEQNGCLWFVPGSHKGKLYAQWVRKMNDDGAVRMEYISNVTKPDADDCDFVPAPAQKGSCVLIHDLVVHRSSKNTSAFSRPAYTFHVWDKHDSEYRTVNWLQPSDALPFPSLYDVQA